MFQYVVKVLYFLWRFHHFAPASLQERTPNDAILPYVTPSITDPTIRPATTFNWNTSSRYFWQPTSISAERRWSVRCWIAGRKIPTEECPRKFCSYLVIGFRCFKILPSGAGYSVGYIKFEQLLLRKFWSSTYESFFVDFRNGWRYRAGGGAALPSASYANISISGTKSLW